MPSVPFGMSASAFSTRACFAVRASLCVESSSAKNALRWPSMVERAARNRFQSSFASFFGRRGPSVWCFCQRANSVVERRRDLLPLRLRGILRGELLRLLDECRALDERGGDERLGLLRLLLGELGDLAAEGLEAGAQQCEVADGVRRGDGLGEVLDGLGDVGGGSAALGALLEQGHLAGELGVLALEVGERLLRRAVGELSDRALAGLLAHEDRSGLVNASPGGYLVCHSFAFVRVRRCAPRIASPNLLHSPRPASGVRVVLLDREASDASRERSGRRPAARDRCR